MSRIVRTAVVSIGLLVLAGCASPTAPRPAPLFPRVPTLAVAVLTHGRVDLAAARWRDSLKAAQTAKLTGDDAADKRALLVAQHEVDVDWAPVADAMRALRTAVDAYQAAVSRGEAAEEAPVLAALCGLWAAVPERWRSLVPAESCR